MRGLRALLTVGGVVAVLAGLDTTLRGVESVPGEGSATTNVDSEIRFYGAFYVAYGLALLWVAPRAARETGLVRFLALALFGAGIARAIGWAFEGRPEDFQLVLLAFELALPWLIIAWQARVARAGPA